MHYVGMAAMKFVPIPHKVVFIEEGILASEGLAAAVVIGTLVILGLALIGSSIDRSLERKNHLNSLLQETIKNRDDFLSVASHELKTPLTSLRLQLGILERKIHAEEINRERFISMVQQGQKSIGQISKVVEEMLDIARISTGRFALDKEEFHLDRFVAELVERIRPNILESHNSITFEADDSVPGEWDKFRIEQVIMNIIMNAALYAKSTNIHIRVWKEGQLAKVSIHDNGIGISSHEHEKIFQRYERGESSKDYRGLGIGLYLVREIISLHNGHISLESELGKGAKFNISLPL